jgi:glycosyltransferase involved in cell wall biosynthesis
MMAAMKRDIQSLKFTIFSHQLEGATGFPEAMGDFLRASGCQLTYISFPFYLSHSKSIWIERSVGEQRVLRRRSLWRFYKPELLSFAKDLGWLLSIGWWYARGSDLVLANDCLLGFAALVFRQLGLIRRFNYLVVDYSPRRFKNPLAEWLYVRLDRLIAEQADTVWTMSLAMLQARANDGRLDLQQVNYRLAPMGNNCHLTFARGEIAYNKRDIVFVGNVNARNVRADFLLDVLCVLRDRGEACRLLFFGPGEMGHLRIKAEELGIADRVILRGSIPLPTDLERELAACGVGTAPYDPHLENNFSKFADPAKIKTYLGCGLPVISTDVPPIAKELAKSGAGRVAEFTAESFADQIVSLWQSPEVYSTARTQARRMGESYSWPRLFSELLAAEDIRCLPQPTLANGKLA